MSFVSNYLNLNNDFSFSVLNNNIVDALSSYQRYYILYNTEPTKVKEYILDIVKNYINDVCTKINIENADINYYIENINIQSKIKFSQVVELTNINHLISMMDYKESGNSNYKYFQNEYYKYFNLKIVNGVYNFKKNPTLHLHEQIDENWSSINFENMINFTHTLNRMKFFGQNVEIFQTIIENKFDSKENIKKLIDYITSNFVEENDTDQIKDLSENEFEQEKRFNFRFVVDNLKANGFSLFEDYYTQIKNRYKQNINIEQIKKDKKLVYYFMQIVSNKDSNSVNRYVNDMLIRIRDYLYDLEDSYNNNMAYQKIKVDLTSEKYANLDLAQIKRENYNFTVLKYCFADEIVSTFKLNQKIEPYFDIYRAYYKSRYPDRDYEIDINKSTFVVKMKFDSKPYYIHMALIQYIVLDQIIKSGDNGINIPDISTNTDISMINLQETINSLIKIKLIRRSNTESVEDIVLVLNKNFSYEKNKISISSMIFKEKPNETTEKVREFMFDKNMIVLCNIIDFVKKNKFFYEDTIIESIKYKIPFNVDNEMLQKSIDEAIKKEIIKKINVPNVPVSSSSGSISNSNIVISEQTMYQLCD